jgi:hypothetical protein
VALTELTFLSCFLSGEDEPHHEISGREKRLSVSNCTRWDNDCDDATMRPIEQSESWTSARSGPDCSALVRIPARSNTDSEGKSNGVLTEMIGSEALKRVAGTGRCNLDPVWSGKWTCLKQRPVRFAVLETQDNELT